jgi:hypothetical protein
MKKLVTFMVFVFCATSIFAQEAPKTERPKDPSATMSAASLALELANYGYANKSVISLVESARIILSTPFQPMEVVKSEPSNGDAGAKVAKAPQLDPKLLLRDAKIYAEDNETLLALVAMVEEEANSKSRGRVAGAAAVQRRVYGNSTYTDYVLFKGQELAEVAVIGDGDTDLDLYVYDENGNFIAQDTNNTDVCYISFTPKWQGSFRVVVKNVGALYNDYVLLTN